MVMLTFNPFKLRTVAHYAYEYVALHGDVKRGRYNHTKPEDAFREGYKLAELYGHFPLQVRVVNERGEIVQPPVEKTLAIGPPITASFTEKELVQALKDAQAAHHMHEAEVLAKFTDLEDLPERKLKAIEMSATWVEWYVAHIFKRKVADSAIEEIVGTL